jgi:hypothetical protein
VRSRFEDPSKATAILIAGLNSKDVEQRFDCIHALARAKSLQPASASKLEALLAEKDWGVVYEALGAALKIKGNAPALVPALAKFVDSTDCLRLEDRAVDAAVHVGKGDDAALALVKKTLTHPCLAMRRNACTGLGRWSEDTDRGTVATRTLLPFLTERNLLLDPATGALWDIGKSGGAALPAVENLLQQGCEPRHGLAWAHFSISGKLSPGLELLLTDIRSGTFQQFWAFNRIELIQLHTDRRLPDEVIPALLDYMETIDDVWLDNMYEVLGNFGKRARGASDAIRARAKKNPKELSRFEAAAALCSIAGNQAEDVKMLRDALQGEDAALRTRARIAIIGGCPLSSEKFEDVLFKEFEGSSLRKKYQLNKAKERLEKSKKRWLERMARK